MGNDFDDDMLEQSESLDSDEVRNDDGDTVVDPPDTWVKADDNESLDEKLAAEISDTAISDTAISDTAISDTTTSDARDDQDGESFFNVRE